LTSALTTKLKSFSQQT